MNAGKKLEGRKKGATSRRPAEHYYFRVQNSAPRDFAYRPFLWGAKCYAVYRSCRWGLDARMSRGVQDIKKQKV